MKIFLLESVNGIGKKGEIKEVAEGYARNFLLPRKMAMVVDTAHAADVLGRYTQIQAKEETEKKRRSALSDRIEALKITFVMKSQSDKVLYGSVGPAEIVEKLSLEGISISKNQVLLEKPIKKIGSFTVPIRLSSYFQPNLKLKIVSE